MPTGTSCRVIILLLAAAVSAPPTARAANYRLTLISAVSNDPVFGPSINDSGQVAFTGTPTSTNRTGVYVGSGGALTTIADATDGRFVGFYGAAINANGAVAFGAGLSGGGNAVYVGDGGTLTAVAMHGPSWVGGGGVGGIPSINADGAVAFVGNSATLGNGVFTSAAGALTHIATSAPIAGTGSDLALNNHGTVAYYANLSGGGTAIIAGNGSSAATIAATGAAFAQLGESPGINDASHVIFDAQRTDGVNAVYVADPTLTIVADSTGPFGSFVFDAINEQNDVAFLGYLRAGGSGIFTGSDPTGDRVIGTGDQLQGASVTGLWFSSKGLNNDGSVAFGAHLSNGTSGIFRADPVPEPATLAILMGACILVVRHAVRRQCR